MRTIDLHVHSNASDGTLSPREVVKLAKRTGLSAMALTDHDTVSGIPEANEEGNRSGIEIIPGIEMSSKYLDKEIHILGLFIDINDNIFQSVINSQVENRDLRNQKMVQRFNDYGFELTYDELLDTFGDCIITRAHFANIMVKKGWVRTKAEAFDKYLGNDCPLYVSRDRMEPEDAIKLIKGAGGIAVLAHPLQYKFTSHELDNLVIRLQAAGLTGIEAIYSANRGFDEVSVRSLARKHGLLITGGSDFHGDNKPDIRLGTGRDNLSIPYDILDELKLAVGKQDN